MKLFKSAFSLALALFVATTALAAPGDITGLIQKNGANNPVPKTITGVAAGEVLSLNSAGGIDSLSLGYIDVKRQFNATGDGVADDTAEIQAAVDATPDYGTCFIPPVVENYKLSDVITINHPMTLVGHRTLLFQTGVGKGGLLITSSNVSVRGIHLEGRQSSAAVSGEDAISIVGASWAAKLSNVEVTQNHIEGWGFYGVHMLYVDGFDVSHNRIENVVYAAVMGISAQHGNIGPNFIANIGVPASVLAYGISLNRTEVDSLVTDPRSSDITVTGNTITGIPQWTGLDTHGGQRITFSGNTVYNCNHAISLGAADNLAGDETFAPLDVNVIGNVVDSGVTDGSMQYGIVVKGASQNPAVAGTPTQYATGTVVGNTVRGYSDDALANIGAITIYLTDGFVVASNKVIEPARYGILFYNTNRDFSATGNSVTDPWTEAGTKAVAIGVISSHNTGFIGGNVGNLGDRVATLKLTHGIEIGAGTGNAVTVGLNHMVDATTLISGTFTGADLSTAAIIKSSTPHWWTGRLAVGSASPSATEFLHIRQDQNSSTIGRIKNIIALGNTSAAASWQLEATGVSGYIGAFPSDYTPGAGVAARDRLVVGANSDASGIAYWAGTTAGQDHKWYANGSSTVAMTLDSTGLTVADALVVSGGITGDGANVTNVAASNISGIFGDITMTGDMVRDGILTLTPNALTNDASIEIDVTKGNNTLTADSNETFVFSATPATGTRFGLNITADVSDRTHTIPSTYSFSQGAAITTFVQKANQRTMLVFERLASSYVVWGVPLYTTDLPTATPDTAADYFAFSDTSTGLESKALLSTIAEVPPSDTAYSSSWNGVTTIAPTKNAVYDYLAANVEHSVSFTVSGAGSPLTTGVQDIIIPSPYAGTFTRWVVSVSPADTITFDILRAADGGAAPSVSVVGGGGTKPNVASGVQTHSSTFTSWTSTTATAFDNWKCQITAVGGTATAATVTLYFQ